jgi:hypothetical protein
MPQDTTFQSPIRETQIQHFKNMFQSEKRRTDILDLLTAILMLMMTSLLSHTIYNSTVSSERVSIVTTRLTSIREIHGSSFGTVLRGFPHSLQINA